MLPFEKHCWAEIDLDALRHNFAHIRRAAGHPVCAVVKADAYGHGADIIAPLLEQAGAAAFAVSCLAEARHLRRCGIKAPVLILGYADPAFAAVLAKEDIAVSLFSVEYAAALSAAAAAAGCTVKGHLKIDTGMGRLGFAVRSDFEQAVAGLEACYSLPGLAVEGLFQHFAAADGTDPLDLAYTNAQYALFTRTAARLRRDGFDPGILHCANSAAQMLHPEWEGGWVRAGIILYGLDPSAQTVFPALRPAMALKTVVTYVKELLPGQSVSYGRTFTNRTNRPLRVATVCVGYADGYPRQLSAPDGCIGGVMRVRGCPAPVIGRVCMDQTMLDVTRIPGVQMGDEVTVFGPAAGAPAADAPAPLSPDTAVTVAEKTGTISYEVVCRISRRVPRVYLQNGKPAAVKEHL